MNRGHYYNEFDPKAAAWLRELMKDGLIPQGEVDERDIAEVQPEDLRGHVQCHFFAGIGGWPLALRLAGWPDDRPVWTGSCPCQPYSSAGKQRGNADERNLWPEFFRLIRECRPDAVFGEQVEGAIRHGWLDGISADLEGEGYAVGHCVLAASSAGAPHIRQRLYWVADAERDTGGTRRTGEQPGSGNEAEATGASVQLGRCGHSCGMGHSSRWGCWEGEAVPRVTTTIGCISGTPSSGMGHTDDTRPQGRDSEILRERADEQTPGPRSAWGDSRVILCRDGKTRRIPASAESVLLGMADGLPGGVDDVRTASAGFPLAGKIPNRASLLRGYGNAIVPQVAAEFVTAYLDCR